jgi:hypothetical protein
VEGEGTSKADAGRLSDFTAMGLRVMLLVLNLLTICSLVASSPGSLYAVAATAGLASCHPHDRLGSGQLVGGRVEEDWKAAQALVGLTSVANHSVGVVRA